MRVSCPKGRLLQSWEIDKENDSEKEKEKIRETEAEEKEKQKEKERNSIILWPTETTLDSSENEENNTGNNILNDNVDTRRLSYFEKETIAVDQIPPQSQPQCSAPIIPPSSVIMLLSDGCIEDISSLLFTTVVSNLSAIVGHDIDGRPINVRKPPTIVQKVASLIDPYGYTCIGGMY